MPRSYPASRWATLALAAAVVSSLIALVRGVGVFDRESIAIGVLLLGFAAVTRTSRATIGWIGLAALLLNQAFWMVSAAWNLTHAAPSFLGALVPSTMAVLSVLGLVASAARARGVSRGATPAAALALVALVALAFAVPAAGRGAAAVRTGDLRLRAHNVEFSTTHLAAHAGTVAVVFQNKDLFWHTFTVRSLHASLRVATGGRGRIVLRHVAPGTYTYVCAIPGHEAAGMKGELVVR